MGWKKHRRRWGRWLRGKSQTRCSQWWIIHIVWSKIRSKTNFLWKDGWFRSFQNPLLLRNKGSSSSLIRESTLLLPTEVCDHRSGGLRLFISVPTHRYSIWECYLFEILIYLHSETDDYIELCNLNCFNWTQVNHHSKVGTRFGLCTKFTYIYYSERL